MPRLFRSLFNMKPPANSPVPLHEVDIPVKKATFGMGCFWSNDSLFGAMPGVIRTRVGYAGGTTKNPHYRNIGDHTEVIEIDYDPKQVSYDDLLETFWANHEYGLTTRIKRQYMSMILCHDEEQRQIAENSCKEMAKKTKEPLRTEIAFAETFYPAEESCHVPPVARRMVYRPGEAMYTWAEISGSTTSEGFFIRTRHVPPEVRQMGYGPGEAMNTSAEIYGYHQKYRLQGHKDLCSELGISSGGMLQRSHLAARLNGYLVGVGGRAQFDMEAPHLGLSPRQQEYVRRELERHSGGGLAC